MQLNYLFHIIILLQLCSFSECKNRLPGNWQCVSRSKKNPVYKVIRKNRHGNTQCATKIPNTCFYTKSLKKCEQFEPKEDGVLTCGNEHKRRFGFTGYDRPQHWCNLKFNNKGAVSRVVILDKKNGNDAKKHEFPFLVRLDLYQHFFAEFDNGDNVTKTERRTCGAFVIHKNWLQ